MKPRCPKCLHRGVKCDGPALDGRPQFSCTGCFWVWTCGHDGGEFKQFVDYYICGCGEVVPNDTYCIDCDTFRDILEAEDE